MARQGITRRTMARSGRGYFGVAVWQPKTEINVGTLWRSAFLYDAAFVATVGRRYEKQASDTPGTANHIPLLNYGNIDDLILHLPHGCPVIGVELSDSSFSLPSFAHPHRALYLLGAEDRGLPRSVSARCHQLVQIPAAKEWSMNVAVAGSIVLYDRFVKGMR